MNDVVRDRKNEVRAVREFLYVDHQRVRSYYSQLNRGVIESVVLHGGGNVAGSFGAKLFGFGPSASYARDTHREESRSLQDLTYTIFEELFEQEGLIEDIKDKANNIETWRNGSLHSSIEEGDIVRYTGSLQILDPDFVRNRLDQYGKMVTAIAGSQVGIQQPESASPPARAGGSARPGKRSRTAEEVRNDLIAEKVQEFTGGISLNQLASIRDFIDAFASNSIVVRVLPFGMEHSEYHFAGTLLSRNEYIQPEREALFSRYGTSLEDWTIVMQVARIPSPSATQAPDFGKSFADNGALDRSGLEKTVGNLVSYMETLGIAEGAQYPAVSVTVLAIYREFAPLPAG